MTLDYSFRMACLCLAVFFLVHLAVGLAVVALAPSAMRWAARQRAEAAARLMYSLRLLPAACAACFVAILCVPSYLRFEPDGGEETVGVACLIFALLCFGVFTVALARGVRAALQSARLVRTCGQAARNSLGSPVALLPGDAKPLLALVGIVHPRIVVSASVMKSLSISELAAALRHERAHLQSRDNLKRLVLMLAPGLLPGWNGFDRLESAWRRFAEWAADDRACAGRPHRSVTLALALVRMARFGSVPAAAELATNLLTDRQELPARVERLLGNAPRTSRRSWALLCGTAAALVALSTLAIAGLTSLETVHSILETIVG